MKTFFYFVLLAYGIFYRDIIVAAFAAWILYDRFVLEVKPAAQPGTEQSLIVLS
jgi:hypothetical protein